MAAWYRVFLVTAAYRSSWLPAEPHLKHRYALVLRFTENTRLRLELEPCTGQGPRSCGPSARAGTKPMSRKISAMERDKIAAARRKGKWVGGMPLLGYDIDPR